MRVRVVTPAASCGTPVALSAAGMWTRWMGGLIALTVALGGCTQAPRREEPNAREAGREAYRASQKLKREAKDAAQQLHEAEKEFREGWSEASRQDNTRRTEPARPQNPQKPASR